MYKNPVGDKIKTLIHHTGSKNMHVKVIGDLLLEKGSIY